MLVDPSGKLSILPDGTIHVNKNDNQTDVQLLQLKIDYANATSDEERNIIEKSRFIDNEWKVLVKYEYDLGERVISKMVYNDDNTGTR